MQRVRFEMRAGLTTAEWLVAGGDARIVPDPLSGLNKYGCTVMPDPDVLAFGSSTASTISQAGFIAADQLRERLLQASAFESFEVLFRREMQRIRCELLSDLADLPVQLLFAASGTDAHALAARCVASAHLLRVIMVEENETGSGVKSALSALACVIDLVSLRTHEGALRAPDEVDAEVVSLVNHAEALGQRVLLIMVDQSKTGLIAPSPVCAARLHQRDAVAVLVDACQFRIAPETLRAYLQQGFMLALTGSKFVSGPSFSGALLLPENFDAVVSDEVNFGLLLRWEAALVEWRRFRALPQADVLTCLEAFAGAIHHRLATDASFEPLSVPQLDRRPLLEGGNWDSIQTIFPFLLYRFDASGNKILLERDQVSHIYRQMQGGRFQLGQPVVCGVREGVEVSALRLCVSARQISDAVEEGGVFSLVADAMAALDMVSSLIRQVNRKP